MNYPLSIFVRFVDNSAQIASLTVHGLFFTSFKNRPQKKSIGATLFFGKNRRFFPKNSVAPKKTPRPIFERSEKEGVNR
jgi:hypothetical protein